MIIQYITIHHYVTDTATSAVCLWLQERIITQISPQMPKSLWNLQFFVVMIIITNSL